MDNWGSIKPPFGTPPDPAWVKAMGCVGLWVMNERAGIKLFDASGNKNTGTMTDMDNPATPTSGWAGQGLSFDGSNDYVDVGTTNLTVGAHTISFWAKPTTNKTQSFGEVKLDNLGFILYNYLGGISFGHRGGIGCLTANDGSVVGGNWMQIAITYSGGNKSLIASYGIYINGTARTIPLNTGVVGGGYTRNFFGKEGNGSPFNGLIDDVRIYNRALSANEVWKQYNMPYYMYPRKTTKYFISQNLIPIIAYQERLRRSA